MSNKAQDLNLFCEEVTIKPCFVKLRKLTVIEAGPDLERPSEAQPSSRPSVARRKSYHKNTCCLFCEKIVRNCNYDDHILAHINERPNICRYCDKEFIKKHGLQCHLNIHLGLRPFKCDICDRTFAASSALVVHRQVLHRNRKYHCPLCSSGYGQKSSLRVHMKDVHNLQGDKILEAMKFIKITEKLAHGRKEIVQLRR